MESCLLSRVVGAADPLSGIDNNHLPLMFPTTPILQINDVISSILQYKNLGDMCNNTTVVKSEPPSPLCSPPAPKRSCPSTSDPTSPKYAKTSLQSSLDTKYANSSLTLDTLKNLLPPNSLLPNTSIVSGSQGLASTSPNTSLLLPNTSLLPNNCSLYTPKAVLSNNALSKMGERRLSTEEVKPSVSPTSSSSTLPTSAGGTSGVKIFQTKQGYTLLICNGYRYSKISTSSNGKKVYWRCTLRSCKGKVHTDVAGGVVYESTHDHPPMAEEFLFSCHSNRLAKEARQIMRYDPLKCLKDEVPYSALESTPTFCKIKDRLNIKKSPSPTSKIETESPIPLKQTYPVSLSTSPAPTLKLNNSKEGTLSVNAPTNGLLTELNTLRLTQHLCDVALCVNGTLIYGHRVVLAAASQYFRLLFLSNTKLLSYVELRGVEAESVQLLVNFAYTGNLEINYSRVTELLTAAQLLHFTPIVEKCCEHVRTQITPQNCIRIREYAALQGLTKLQAILDKYVCSNWTQVTEHEDIYEARPETLLYFLGHDELQVEKEADVYKIIIAWVRRSPLYRQFYVGELLRKVRLVQLNAKFLLDNIETEELVRQHRECETLLHRAKNHFLLPERDNGLEDYHFRKRRRKHNVCLLGRDEKKTIVYEYDTVKNTAWESCSTELNRKHYCLANSDDVLYVIGGQTDTGQYSTEVTTCNLRDKAWSTAPCSLSSPRSKICCAPSGVLIYLFGGETSTGTCDTAEVIDTATNTLSHLPCLPKPISNAISCVVGDLIYVVGGRTTDGMCSSSLFAFNTTINQWKELAPLPSPLQPNSMFYNIDDMIYIIGADNQLYRYNLGLDAWYQVVSDDTDNSETVLSCSADGDVFAMRRRDNGMFLDKLDGATTAWIPCCSVDLPLTLLAMCPRPAE